MGMQLMASWGREFEDVAGLGWIPGEVVAIKPKDPALKIPHMGWNELEPRGKPRLLAGVAGRPFVYFAHSYYVVPVDARITAATTDVQCQTGFAALQ